MIFNYSRFRIPLDGETKRICGGLPGIVCTKEVGRMVVASSTDHVVDVESCTIGNLFGRGLIDFSFCIFQNGPPSSAIC